MTGRAGEPPIITHCTAVRQTPFDKKPTHLDKKSAVDVKKEAFYPFLRHVAFGIPITETNMSLRKPLILAAILALASLAACSDVTGPQPTGFCGITGGPGTCVSANK